MASPECLSNKCKYTDVVIVGNGPSAITLSYLLHGYRPYYNGNSHSNAALESKLQDSKASIVEQDLEYLSEGLEGRSPNPVALLWDALMHPDADLGIAKPPLISWVYEPEKAKSHLVLGKMKPGGSWQRMEGSMQTLSQSGWMELPGLPFRQWLDIRRKKLDFSSSRATTGDVRDYYEEYVAAKGLSDHFMDHHVVTSVQKVFCTPNGVDCESGEAEPCCQNIRQNHKFLWEVRGYRIIPNRSEETSSDSDSDSDSSCGGRRRRFSSLSSDSDSSSSDSPSSQRLSSSVPSSHRWSNSREGGRASPRSRSGIEDLTDLVGDMWVQGEREDFCFVTGNVVLATGTFDIPNRLGVVGEKDSASVIHSLCAFEQYLSRAELKATSAPICVVGAGLSAADAVLMALEAGVPVIHVFRCGPGDPSLIFRRLPQTIYPEYHRVAQLMRGEIEHELYQSKPFHRVVEIGHGMVLLKPTAAKRGPTSRSPSPPGSDSSIISVDVSLTVVMIGSRPDLTFLNNEGRDLGLVPKWPIDSKHNPVDVDPFTYQSVRETGLYAMGPLIGDNFVRFGIGGALGITNHMVSEN